jgi:hypothetical protein
MGVDYITMSQLPPEFMDELMREFRPYTVALSKVRNNDAETFRALGAGVFVTKGKRFGILSLLCRMRHNFAYVDFRIMPHLACGPSRRITPMRHNPQGCRDTFLL